MFITDLNYHTWILCEECLHDVAILADVVEIDVQTTLLVGKAHLEQGGNETTGRDIMTSHNPAFLDELLDSHKGISKVFGILHRRHIVAYLA